LLHCTIFTAKLIYIIKQQQEITMSQSPFWNDDWMKIQNQYWEQLNQFSRQAANYTTPPKSPWEGAMDQWWQTISPNVDAGANDFMQKMIEQGKSFMHMGESLSQNMEHTNNWTEALEKTFSQMHKNVSDATNSAHEGMNKVLSFWQSPQENWQKFAGNMPFANMEPMMESMNLSEKMLGIPSVGYSRESEEQTKALMQAGVDYQSALLEYNNIFNDLGTVAIMRMKDKVQALQDEKKSIDSARALYDLWVAVCEEAYAERVMTEEYTKVHGELVNALMTVKKIWGQLVDKRLSDMQMPTQREVRTVQDRLQQSRRDMRSMEKSMKAMVKEVEALKQQFSKLTAKPAKAQPAPKAEAKPPKAAPRKKAVSKKSVAKKTAARKAD
jgi:class III poly(R)-hydroxyalkanoic acid synthase PhaE subunit